MRVVVLAKPVPDASGDEAFEADQTLDRTVAAPTINPNDEYALEAALRLAEQRQDVEIVTLSMAPSEGWAGLQKAVAVGAKEAVMVTDDVLAGSCILGTANVLAAALRKTGFDLVLAGTDTPDGRAGVACASIAALLDVPMVSNAAALELRDASIVISRTRDDGRETLEADLPAFVTVTQQVGVLRYPNLRGIMAARGRRPTTWTLADLDLSGSISGGASATTVVLDVAPAAARPPARVVKGDPSSLVPEILAFLAERRLIP